MRFVVALLALVASATASADWRYSENTDAMTSKRTSYAELESNNSLALGHLHQDALGLAG